MNTENPIVVLARETGKSRVTIYKMYHKLHRLPTKEEVLNWRKAGRPRKLDY